MKKVFLTFLLLLGCSEVPKKNNNEVLLYEAQITGICTDAYPSQAGYPAKSYNVSGDIRVSRIRIENLYMYETFIMPTEENLLESIKKAEDTFGDNIDNVSFDEINKIMKEPDLISIPSLSSEREDSYLVEWKDVDQVYLTQDSWKSVQSIHYFASYDGLSDNPIDGTCDLMSSEQQHHQLLWLSGIKNTQN